MTERRYADSITFTVEQLDDLIVCVSYALREGAGYGHVTREEEEKLAAERRKLKDMLERFERAAKRRGRRRL